MILYKKDIAAALGVGMTTLENMEKTYGPIQSTMDGKKRVFTVKNLIDWYHQKVATDMSDGADGEQFNYEKEKARLTHYQADRADIENQKIRGELVDAQEVQDHIVNVIIVFRKSMLNVPNRVSHPVSISTDEIEIKEIIKKEIHDSLNELSDTLQNI